MCHMGLIWRDSLQASMVEVFRVFFFFLNRYIDRYKKSHLKLWGQITFSNGKTKMIQKSAEQQTNS